MKSKSNKLGRKIMVMLCDLWGLTVYMIAWAILFIPAKFFPKIGENINMVAADIFSAGSYGEESGCG